MQIYSIYLIEFLKVYLYIYCLFYVSKLSIFKDNFSLESDNIRIKEIDSVIIIIFSGWELVFFGKLGARYQMK